MTDKRKKRARAIQAKSGIAYASAINQLKEQLGDEPQQEPGSEEPKPPRWTFEEGKTLFDGQLVDSGTWGRGHEGEVSALSDLWPQGPDDLNMVQDLAEECRSGSLQYSPFKRDFIDLADKENNPTKRTVSKNVRPYRPIKKPDFKCLSNRHLSTIEKIIDLKMLRSFRDQTPMSMVNIINQTFEDGIPKGETALMFFGIFEGVLDMVPVTCGFKIALVSNEHFELIKGLIEEPPKWLKDEMAKIVPRPPLRDWVKNPPSPRPDNSYRVESHSEARAWDAKIPKQQVASVYPETIVALCKSVVDEALIIIQKMPFSLRVGYVAGLCLQRDPEVNIPLLTNYLKTMADSWAPFPKPQ